MTEAPRLADHLALDFLNTVVQVDGEPVDFLATDDAVRLWLDRFELLPPGVLPSERPHALHRCAQGLRDIVRDAVERRRDGEPIEVDALNAFLARDRSVLRMAQPRKGPPSVQRAELADTPEHLLMPIARAAAELLAHGDFDLVRRCEGADCSLSFYDRTKSHRRRWCSMATCGNRHKVASYRARQA